VAADLRKGEDFVFRAIQESGSRHHRRRLGVGHEIGMRIAAEGGKVSLWIETRRR